jgi:hypothetical protein
MSHHRNGLTTVLLTKGLRWVCIPVLAGLAACQSLADADQRAFVAAHVVKAGGSASDEVIYLAQDAAYARLEGSQRTVVAQVEPRQ